METSSIGMKQKRACPFESNATLTRARHAQSRAYSMRSRSNHHWFVHHTSQFNAKSSKLSRIEKGGCAGDVAIFAERDRIPRCRLILLLIHYPLPLRVNIDVNPDDYSASSHVFRRDSFKNVGRGRLKESPLRRWRFQPVWPSLPTLKNLAEKKV